MHWYVNMVGTNEESAQRHGIVTVILGTPTPSFRHVAGRVYMLETGTPARSVAIHVCLLERTLNAATRVFLRGLGDTMRRRLRIHLEGTVTRSLSSYLYLYICIYICVCVCVGNR